MKNRIFLIALIAAITLCGCADAEAKANTETSAVTETAETTEATAVPETTEAAEAPETAEPADRGEQLTYKCFELSEDDLGKMIFYKGEADESEEYCRFDSAYGFLAVGDGDSSTAHPENFDLDELEYIGGKEYEKPDIFEIKTGDKFGGVTVGSASTIMYKFEDGCMLTEMTLDIDGEYEMTGRLDYFFDDDYMIFAGDMRFVPTDGLCGLPLLPMCDIGESFSDGIGVRSELAFSLSTGNYLSGTAGYLPDENGGVTEVKFSDGVMEKLDGIFGDAKGARSLMVKVKLSDIRITWSDNFGLARSRAVITDIEEL